MDISIKTMAKSDIPGIVAAFKGSEWRVVPSFFENFLAEQDAGKRVVLIAFLGKYFTGYVTIKWKPDYPPFLAGGIPEINDLRVLRAFRRRGIATALLDEAERRIFAPSPVAGIGVGLYADYGAAQRLYVLRGYVPDGRGAYHNNRPVSPGHNVFVDDELLLFFTKNRPNNLT